MKAQNNLLALLTGAFIILSAPVVAWAATAAIEPQAVSTNVGKTFSVSVVFSSDVAFNAGEATVSFDASKLSMTGATKGSAFSIWQTEPHAGNPMTFAGGATSPQTGKQTMVKMTFKAKAEGTAEIKFDKASIISMDTSAEIADAKNSATVTIGPGSASPAPSPKNDAVAMNTDSSSGGGDLPAQPFINSKTYAKEDDYAGGNSAKFDWDLPPDVTIVSVEVDQSSSTVPTKKYEPAIADIDVHDMVEGENWIHVRFRNGSGWGKVAHRKFLFDKTAPKDFTVTASSSPQSSNASLVFTTEDSLSGLDHYDIVLDGSSPRQATESQMKSGSYLLAGLANGSHNVKVFAVDKAGNKSSAEASFSIDAPIKSDSTGTENQDKGWPWGSIFATIFGIVIGLLSGVIWKERHEFKMEKFNAKREADETRDRVAAVFAALREEVRDRLGELADLPNPSALDREVAKRMNEALDLSEELINKEVEDVRKLLSH